MATFFLASLIISFIANSVISLPCDDPPAVAGGYIASQQISTRTFANKTVISRSSKVTYICLRGTLIGNSIVNCVNGQWIDALPICSLTISTTPRVLPPWLSQTFECKYGLPASHSICLPNSPSLESLGSSPQNDILTRHNYWRQNVSPPPKRPLPKLQWDIDLAIMAERWAAQCTFEHTPTTAREIPERPPDKPSWTWVGQNMYISWGFTSPNWTQAIDSWAQERQNWTYGIGQIGNSVVGHYTQLIWQDTLFVGCGKADCEGLRHIMVCNYGPGGNLGVNGQNPYAHPYKTAGNGADDSEEEDFSGSGGFLSSGYGALGATQLVTLPPRGPQCRYRLQPPHALCLTDSPDLIGYERSSPSEIIARHNFWRARVSPPAQKLLPELRWDNDLATMSERWASQCKMGHDQGETRKLPYRGANGSEYNWVGQNICYSWGYSMSWTECINSWAAERKDWQYGLGQVGPGIIGHYTQLIWEDTLYVGCGKARCRGGTVEYVLVCDYAPGGNVGINGANPHARPYERQ